MKNKTLTIIATLTFIATNIFCQTKIKSKNGDSNLNICCGPDADAPWIDYISPNSDLYEIKCSSTLPNQGAVSYVATNLDDAKLNTAWCEGDSEYGIGTTIEYTIKTSFGTILQGESNTISAEIVNGYYKNEKSYLENSRVKSFNCYLNNKLIAVIELNDFRGTQNFELVENIKKGDVLKFEITDVYKGTKYKDVLITEFRLN